MSQPAPKRTVSAKTRHMPYGDAARVLGTIAVVVGHVCDRALFDTGASVTEWWVSNLIDAACRWAVPVYIMLSGALLLDPQRAEGASEFYSKRLARLGLPIVVWSAFYMWFSISVAGNEQAQVWKDLMLGQPYIHLHFIFRIAGLYAFTPMLRVFLRHADTKTIRLATLLALGLACGNSVLDAWTGSELSAFIRFAPFLGYYMLGYLLRETRLNSRALLGTWMLFIACVLLLAGGTGLLAGIYGIQPYPSLGFVLYDFLSPVRIPMAICAWLIVVNTFDSKWAETGLSKFVSKWIAPATLGIYLVHVAFRDALYVYANNFENTSALRVWVTGVFDNIWIAIPLVSVAIYLASLVTVFILMKIPFVRRIVG